MHSKNQHALEYRIRIAFTAESLLNGPLAVYNMDDLKATSALYKILRDINDNNVSVNKQQFRMIAISLEEALLKRRQLSQEVVASLLRETTRLIKKEEVPKIYLLELVRLIASVHLILFRNTPKWGACSSKTTKGTACTDTTLIPSILRPQMPLTHNW